MGYLGTWQIDDLLTFAVNTHTPSTGAATDADAVPAYRVYEDETGTAILTGNMAKLDDANTTGFYSEQITLSAANGFEVGKSYTVYVSAVVGGVTGTLSHSFQVEAAPATAAALATVQADTDNIQTRLPAALVSGRMDASVGAMANDVITSNVIAANAIGANEIANNAIHTSAIATGAISAAKFADNAITNAAIADTAVADIAVGIWNSLTADHQVADTLGKAVSDILDDTGTSGVVVAAGSKSGYSLSAAGVQAIWDALTSGLTTAGSIGKFIVDNLTGGAATAAAVWNYLTSAITTTGSIGKLIKDKLALITTATELSVDSPVNAGMLTITKAVSLDSGLLDVTVPAGWTKCFVTGKKDKDDPDADALFQIVESNPGVGTDGLLYLNGAAGTAAQGSVTVDEGNNQVSFSLTDNATAQLPRRNGHWDIKFLKSDGSSTRPVAGLMQIVLPVTLTI